MKNFFKWCPLKPPCDEQEVDLKIANLVGLCAALVGFLMIALGLGTGPWVYLPLALSAFLFGLPHGAIDHLVLIGLADKTMGFWGLVTVCSIYLALVIAVLFLWWVSPLVGLTQFLLITIYHWGKSDLAFERFVRRPNSEISTSSAFRLPHLLFRGSIPVCIPFLSFPKETEAFIISCTSSFGYSFELSPSLRFGILAYLIILLIGELLFLKRNSKVRSKRLLEDIGLLFFFWLVTPILAIGLYFSFWHGFRHVLRLIRYESNDDSLPDTRKGLKRFYAQALPFTLASLLIVAAVGLLLPQADRLDQLPGIYLVVISCLTVPHFFVVEWMDIREGVSLS
ncbi:MAG: Brp/Blh family beta-carotene 15,15'-dioxygenase [Verrucomicrobiota bacterium]